MVTRGQGATRGPIGRIAGGCTLALLLATAAAPARSPERDAVRPAPSTPAAATRTVALATMKRATRFMVDKLAYRGGYVWSYLPDRSRQWGELEAYPTMIWVQPPGTATVGHLLLDAYHATGDAYYYRAAAQAAAALVAGQKPQGGWHYFIDFGGAASTRRWYDTIGRNAWRMEEFQHDWGNATYDDGGTGEAIRFLTRMSVERPDPQIRAALTRAIDFVLASQLDNGGWPQRWPFVADGGLHGRPDYTRLITFNDSVIADNIDVLVTYHQATGDARVLPAIRRGMDIYIATRQPAPQAGWGLQHTPDLKPAGARSYEPVALVTHTTATNIAQLMQFFRMTGDRRYLAPIPDALAWLESVRLPAAQQVGGRQFPTFVQIGTNRPLYVHRRGSNVVNGEYYVDHDPADTIGHYNARRAIDTAALAAEYRRLAAPPAGAPVDPALGDGRRPLRRYWTPGAQAMPGHPVATGQVARLAASLNREGWWPTPLRATSHRYTRDGSATVTPGDYRTTDVGDATDTSPFDIEGGPVAISTGVYIDNMAKLIAALPDAR